MGLFDTPELGRKKIWTEMKLKSKVFFFLLIDGKSKIHSENLNVQDKNK